MLLFEKLLYSTLFMIGVILGGYYAFPNQGLNNDPNLHSF